MALAEFQRAFADLIASPERCLAARAPASTVFDCYDLTPIERRRIQTMVRDHGMSINCTLYRVNRLTPVYSVLPLSCKFLGECLTAELDGFWAASRDATLQYGREAWRFGLWIQDRIASGILSPGPVEDAVRFELAAFEVRTAPNDLDDNNAFPHPRKRLVSVRYDPDLLLDLESNNELLVPLTRPVLLMLDGTGHDLKVDRIFVAP